MAAKDEFGRAGEERAAQHLSDLGYRIMARNWRCAQGELDIVAARDDVLCVVEVKTRRSELFGHPFDAVDERKLRRLWRLAFAWARSHPEEAAAKRIRIDVIGLTGADVGQARIDHLEDLR